MKLIKQEAPTDVIAHDVAPLTVNTDARSHAKLGWIIVLVGFCGFLLWAVLAPLDKGVPMMGTVAKESNRKAVQHLTGGTIDEILVREGDHVKAGQPLVRMNAVQAKAQQEISLVQYFAGRSAEARLLAERDGKSSVPFPEALVPYKSDARAMEAVRLQEQLFNSRQSALRNELGAADQSIEGLKLTIAGLEASRDSKKEQMAYLKEQIDNLKPLVKDGYVARNRLLEIERTYAQTSGALAEDVGNLGRTRAQITEVTMKKAQRLQEFQRDARTQLADVQKEVNALQGRMTAEDYLVKNVEVKAPVDGTVMGLAVYTAGGVVQPGFRMMDIVPSDDPLVVEGQLPINLVDKVHVGLPVEFIFTAFNANRTPHIPGEVMTVSADRLVDEKTGAPYYKVMARVTPKGQKIIAQQQMQVRPGMPVELFVKTGERTMMNYLLKPVFDRSKTALSEE